MVEVYAVSHDDILKYCTEITDQPYWSLNLVDEETDFDIDVFKTWTESNGYRYFVEVSDRTTIDRLYAVNVTDFEIKWYVLHGHEWPYQRLVNGEIVDAERHRGFVWPDGITVMMHGTWNAVRYLNIKEGVGYEPDAFAEHLLRDLVNLQKIVLASGMHYLRTDDLPTLPLKV